MKEKIIEFLQNNPWLNLIFLFLAILGIILTLYTFFKSKSKKRGVYNFKSFEIFSDKITSISNLSITYKEIKIKNLTTTYFALWNQGNSIIEKVDVAPIDPLKISIKSDFQIFEFEVKTLTNSANNFTFSLVSPQDILIDFDYFAKDEGAIIKIQHSGKGIDDFEIHGTIKGFGKLQYAHFSDDFLFGSYLNFTLGWLIRYHRKKNKPKWTEFLFMILAFVQIPILIFPFAIDKLGAYSKKIPKAFAMEGEE